MIARQFDDNPLPHPCGILIAPHRLLLLNTIVNFMSMHRYILRLFSVWPGRSCCPCTRPAAVRQRRDFDSPYGT